MPSRARRTTPATPKRRRDVWQAGLVPIDLEIDDTPDARPALRLLMCDGRIVHGDIVAHPPDDARGVAAQIAAGLQAATDATERRPGTIEVLGADVAIALDAILKASHPAGDAPAVRAVDRMPEMDDAIAAFTDRLASLPRDEVLGRVTHPETWAGWNVPREQIGRLFAAAARYHRGAPWKLLYSDDILRLTMPGGSAWSAVVLGNAGDVCGLVLYADHGDLMAGLSAESPAEAIASMEDVVLSLRFGPKDDLSPRARKEILWSRWEVAGTAAYPDLMTFNTPDGGVTERQMDDLITALDVVERFAATHAARLEATFDVPTILTWTDEESGVEVGLARAIA
jgi:hypothetical protein